MGTIITFVYLIGLNLIKLSPVLLVSLIFCRQAKKNRIWDIGLLLSIVFLISLTINGLASEFIFQGFDMEWNPEINIIPFVNNYNTLKSALNFELKAVINVFGNIVMFIPFGFFLGKQITMKKSKDVKRTTIMFVCMTSVCIELLQLIFGRCADIDDVIYNTLGGTLGYWGLVYNQQVKGRFLGKPKIILKKKEEIIQRVAFVIMLVLTLL